MPYHAFIEVTKGETGQLKAIFNVYDDGARLYVDELNAEMVHEEVAILRASLEQTQSPSKEKELRRQLTEFNKAAMRMPLKKDNKPAEEFLYDGLVPDPHAPGQKQEGPTRDPHAPKKTAFC
jgi:hypothetical protein